MILISTGHNPKQQGAEWNGKTEYKEGMKWTALIMRKLDEAGHNVAYVPTGTLTEKVKYINSTNGVKVAIEIHFNSDPGRKGRGSETLFCPGSTKGKELAEMIQSAFKAKNICQPNRGAKEGWYRMDRPDHVDYVGDVNGDEKIDYFLKSTNPVAAIVEPEFMHNLDKVDMDAACQAIADAIDQFYTKHYE
jgi:N-acetylmuramoyl-L-alanine amidase